MRTQRVVLETPNHRIAGDLTLPREGYRSRLSDYLNRDDLSFVSLVNVTIFSADASTPAAPTEREFVAVGIAYIQFAYPDED